MRQTPKSQIKDIISENWIKKTSVKTKKRTHEIISEYFENLEKQVKELVFIKKIIYKKNTSWEEILSNLEYFFEQILSNSSPKTKEQWEKIKNINIKNRNKKYFKHKYISWNENCIYFYDEEYTIELLKVLTIYNWIARIKVKIEEFNFFKKYREIFQNQKLIELYETKIKWSEDENIFFKIFGQPEEIEKFKKWKKSKLNFKQEQYIRIQEKVSKNNLSYWVFENLSLSFFINNENYKKITWNNSSWTHYPNTIISFIKSDPKEQEKTLIHEQRHNILETFFPNVQIWNDDFFNTSLRRMETFISYWANKSIIEEERKILFKKIKNFFDSSIIELLCDYEVLFNWENSTAFTNYDKLVKQINYNEKIIDELKVNDEYKKELKKLLPKLIKKFIEEYKKIYKNLADLLYIADKTWLKDELFALFNIYKPSKFWNINNYLENKLGKNTYEYLLFARQVIKPQYFKLPKEKVESPVDKLFYAIFQIKLTSKIHEIWEDRIFNKKYLENINRLKFENNQINEEIKNILLKKNYNSFTEENSINSITELEELIMESKKLFSKLWMSKIQENKILDEIYDDYIYEICENVLDGKFSSLFDILNNASEKSDFIIYNTFIKLENELESEYENKKILKALEILRNHERSSRYFNQ